MARGDSKTAPSYIFNSLNGDYNMSTDTVAWSLISDQYSTINVNAAGTLTMGDLTLVASSGNYTAGTALASKSVSRSGATITIDGADISVTANAGNPVTARCMAFYNDTSTNDDVLCVVDITADGTTPVDLTNGFTDTLNALGLIQVTVNA